MIRIDRLPSIFSRIAVTLIAAVYLLFSVGIIKATHYCMGRKASVTYFTGETKKCPCSLFANEKNSCCDDEHDLIRIEDDQQSISAYTLDVPRLFILEDLYIERYIAAFIQQNQIPEEIEVDTSPQSTELFKVHCSFVFYEAELAA